MIREFLSLPIFQKNTQNRRIEHSGQDSGGSSYLILDGYVVDPESGMEGKFYRLDDSAFRKEIMGKEEPQMGSVKQHDNGNSSHPAPGNSIKTDENGFIIRM